MYRLWLAVIPGRRYRLRSPSAPFAVPTVIVVRQPYSSAIVGPLLRRQLLCPLSYEDTVGAGRDLIASRKITSLKITIPA